MLSRSKYLSSLLAIVWLLGLLVPNPAHASNQNPNTNFLSGHYGLFIQYGESGNVDSGLTIAQWNADVNSFNVPNFVKQAQAVGASYVVFMLGQNNGFFIGPNATYEAAAGLPTGSRMSSRDLITELGTALQAVGIKLMLYLPSGAPEYDTVVSNALGWTSACPPGDSGYTWCVNSTTGAQWASFIQAWSTHYGTLVSGWWFDGYYDISGFTTNSYAQEYDNAVLAGNPNGVVTFDPWEQTNWYNGDATPVEDYTPAPGRGPGAPLPSSTRWLATNDDSEQWNATWTLESPDWGASTSFGETYTTPPSDTTASVASWLQSVVAAGGASMMDVKIDATGMFAPQIYSQIVSVNDVVNLSNCSATAITPYIYTPTGGWQSISTVTVAPGTTVNLGPQPISGGTWSWVGLNGFSSTSREVDSVPLIAGNNYFMATYTNSSGCLSTQEFIVTMSGEGPYDGSAATIPGVVLAENYDAGGQGVGYNVSPVDGPTGAYRTDGVDLEPCYASACGYDLGWTHTGQWFRYTVNVATAGTYTVSFEVSNGSGSDVSDAFHISNSSGANLSGSVAVPSSVGFQQYEFVTATVTLGAGVQTLTLNVDNLGWNIFSASFALNGSLPVAGTSYAIINQTTGMELDSLGQTGNGAGVDQWSNIGGANRQWSFTLNSDGYYTITNNADREVLNGGGTPPPGSALTLWQAVSSPNLEWALNYVGNGYYTIVNHTSGQAIDGAGSTFADAEVNTITGSTNQQWLIVPTTSSSLPTPGTWYTIVNDTTGLVLDSGDRIGNGVAVDQYSNISNPNLQWSFTLNPDGYFTITNNSDGEVLNGGGTPPPGTGLTLWSPVSSPNVEWELQPGSGGYTLLNHTSGLVIDGTGNTGLGNQAVELNAPTGSTNQNWQIVTAH